jgi:hypothetical protein
MWHILFLVESQFWKKILMMAWMKPPRRKRRGITRHSGENRNPEIYLTGSRINSGTPQAAG